MHYPNLGIFTSECNQIFSHILWKIEIVPRPFFAVNHTSSDDDYYNVVRATFVSSWWIMWHCLCDYDERSLHYLQVSYCHFTVVSHLVLISLFCSVNITSLGFSYCWYDAEVRKISLPKPDGVLCRRGYSIIWWFVLENRKFNEFYILFDYQVNFCNYRYMYSNLFLE